MRQKLQHANIYLPVFRARVCRHKGPAQLGCERGVRLVLRPVGWGRGKGGKGYGCVGRSDGVGTVDALPTSRAVLVVHSC